MKSTLFTDLALGRELQQALQDADHKTPTPIQAAAIPVILEGRDLLGCAQTGTGKTAAFALPLLQQLHSQKLKTVPKAPLALVLVPTRELAAQVMESFRKYGKHLKIGRRPSTAASTRTRRSRLSAAVCMCSSPRRAGSST